jgi:hypothetical protein
VKVICTEWGEEYTYGDAAHVRERAEIDRLAAKLWGLTKEELK